MKIVEKIKDPIYQEMELFEKKFTQMMSSKVPLLNRITYFIVKRKGKQIRPMLVFLVAKMIYSNKLGEKSYSCLLYTSPSPRDRLLSRMPSSA